MSLQWQCIKNVWNIWSIFFSKMDVRLSFQEVRLISYSFLQLWTPKFNSRLAVVSLSLYSFLSYLDSCTISGSLVPTLVPAIFSISTLSSCTFLYLSAHTPHSYQQCIKKLLAMWTLLSSMWIFSIVVYELFTRLAERGCCGIS